MTARRESPRFVAWTFSCGDQRQPDRSQQHQRERDIGRATDPRMAQEPRKTRTEGEPGRVHDDDDKGERDELCARIRAEMARNQGAGSTVARAIALADHSHSMVPGGLDVTS